MVVIPPEVTLAEGTSVEVIPEEIKPEADPFLAAVAKAAKPRPHWPKNYASNLDHYMCKRVSRRF